MARGRSVIHLDAAAVIAIHAEVLSAHGGAQGLRDRALLESAVAAPQAAQGGQPLLRDAIEAAACYLFYLCRHHPFVDGSKTTALATGPIFMQANGHLKGAALGGDVGDWEALVVDVAASRIDRKEATHRLRQLLA